MYAIEIRNLVKRFGDLKAVDDISFSIKKGEIFGLLGPNGAGKTTTINLILNLLEPTSGKVLIDGLDVTRHYEEIKQRIGLMTQETVVEPDLTARQNLWLFAKLYHVPNSEIPGRVEDALKAADLVEFGDEQAGMFSGGMKRRLQLVKTMIHRPQILILDEPTTGLDVQSRVDMWRRIEDLNKRGVTIVLTTQYLEEADELCNRIAIIDHGKIKDMGTPSELKRNAFSGRILEIIVDKSDTERTAAIVKDKLGIKPEVKGERIYATVEGADTASLKKIATAIESKGIKIISIGLHLPTLDDVFIKLTGSSIRDALGEQQSSRSMAMLRR
ncbi:MAG: ATP-binding cassette domain-containing protein [Candidatus Micrarchaeaceae archaeon]